MGSRKKRVNKQQKKKHQEDRNKEIKRQIEIEKGKAELNEIKQQAHNQKMRMLEENIVECLKILGLLAFGATLVGVLVLLVWCLILYCQGNNIANVVLTVIQVITGIVSLGVGIWALILTIKYNNVATMSNNRSMNINVSNSNSNIEGRPESDVNQVSLQ